MYILRVLGLLFSFEDFGFPHVILLPILFLGVGVAQFFLFRKFKLSWLLSMGLFAAALGLEVLMQLTSSWAAMVYLVCLVYVMSCLLGSLLGLLAFFAMCLFKCNNSQQIK